MRKFGLLSRNKNRFLNDLFGVRFFRLVGKLSKTIELHQFFIGKWGITLRAYVITFIGKNEINVVRRKNTYRTDYLIYLGHF